MTLRDLNPFGAYKGKKVKNKKNHSKPNPVNQSPFKQFKQKPNIFVVFHLNFDPFALCALLVGC